MLPLWIALVATGASRVGALFPRTACAAVLAAVVVAAGVAPAAVSEPRTIPTGTKRAVTAPADWLRTQLTPGAVLRRKKPRRTRATRLPSRASRRELTRPRQFSCRFPCADRSTPRRYAARA
jgi:hypothetical protein